MTGLRMPSFTPPPPVANSVTRRAPLLLAALLAAAAALLLLLLAGAPAHAQTVVWNATLTSADSWAVGNDYTYDGYGSSAFGPITTTQGSLSPDSFTVGTTTHTVQLLGVREGTDNRLYLFTDTAVSKSDLAGYAMEFTVDGSTTTLKVEDATPESNLGFYWAESLHSFDSDDWQAKTITVKLLLIVPGAPTGLTVTEGHHAVKLDWTAPADDGGSTITGYEVTSTEGIAAFVTGSTSESFTVDIQSDNNYPFQVRAVNANGKGPWSSAVTGTIGPATVTIAGDGGVNEGFNAGFTLTASKPVLSSSRPLNVSVSVSESEDMVASAEEGAKTVSFAMGDTTATLSVPTVDDGVVESDSVVTAAIQTNTDYTVGTDGSGTVTVADNDTTANTPATGAPTITGTAQVGQMLTAATSGIMDADGLATPGYTYQWIRVDGGTEADISGAMVSTYTLVAADLGKTIKVKVSFTDDASNAETLTSAATTAVTAAATTTNTYVSNIDQGNDSDWSDTVKRAQTFTTGSQSGGYTVTSVDIGYDDAEGDKFSAAIWTVDSDNEPDDGDNNNKVADLTAPTGTWGAGFTLTFTAPAGTTLDAGTTYAVVLTATGNAVRLDSTTSDDEDSGAFAGWSIADTGYFISSNTWTANPTGKALRIAIKGTTAAKVDDCADDTTTTCSVSPGTPVTGDIEAAGDEDYFSLSVTSGVTYRIDVEGSPTNMGTLGNPYLFLHDASDTELAHNDDGGTGSNARLTWTASSTGTFYVFVGGAFSSTGTYTLRVSAGSANNPATGAPTISGTAQVGQMLSVATSGIMDADGLATPGYTYQWIRVDGGTEADISGATASTYTLVAADVGKTIKVKVSFTDDASNAETLTSAATTAVTAVAAADDCAGDWTSTCSVSPGSSVTGDVESSGDKDSFRLSVTSGVTYRIDAEGAPTSMGTLANPYLELRDSSWLLLDENDDGGAGTNAHVTWPATFTGDVFVVIRPPNSMDTGTYTLTVSVSNNLASGPLVSITVDAGDEQIFDSRPGFRVDSKAKFRVSIPAALTADLDVTVNISEVSDTRTDLGNAQPADHVAAADEGPKTVTIAAGDTSAVHETPIETGSGTSKYGSDEVFEQDGVVRAEVAPGFGYRASASAPSAGVRVLDTDQPLQVRGLHSDGSPLTGGARLARIRVDEGARKVVVLTECVMSHDREPRPQSHKISLTTQKITAEFRNTEDYASFSLQVPCADPDDPALGDSGTSTSTAGPVPWGTTGFRRVQRDGGWIYQSVVTVVGFITEDQVYDPDETFRVALQRGPNLPNYVELVTTRAPGSTNSNSSHLVTILDDARAPANLEATVEGVVVGLTWDELPGPRPVETYEVKVNDGPWRALDTGPGTHGVVGGLTPGVENTITVGARYWGPERPRFGRGDCAVFNCSVTVMGPMLDTAHADGPGAVTGLAVSRMGFGEAKLSWTPPSDTGTSGIGGYQWRATGGSFDVEPEFLNRWHDIAPSVMETNGNTTSAIINWLEGVDHTIYLRAWSGLRKYPGAVASVTLTGTGANQPTNLRATARADTWMTLSWTEPSTRPGTIDEYHVETRDPFTDNQWSFGGEGTGGTGTTYTVEGLEPGVEYTFRVRGRSDSLGLFTPSDYFTKSTRSAGSPAQALAQVVYPPGATSLFAYANGGSRIDLGWITTNPASTRYDLEWSADGATGWQAVDPDDDGADTTYGHTGLTADTTYYYRVRGVNGDGPGPWALASATTSAPAPKEAQAANNPATGAPAITGTAQVGETLTADTADIADADGLAKATFSYQWQADGADISGATDSTYTLADADEGAAISVTVSFTDDGGNDESLASAATAAVEAAADDDAAEPTDRPHGLTAEASDGAVVLTWTAPEGYTYDYQIQRHRPELGETEPLVYVEFTEAYGVTTYTDTEVEAGVLYVYRVTTIDFLGDAGEASSPAQIRMPATSQQATNSPATGAPTITGKAQVGETLTADTSGIADDDGLDNASFSYQWLADGADISGATGSAYTLADADEGKAVSLTVSFTDDAGNDETLTSAATDAVEPETEEAQAANSPATGAPTISGLAQVGETLTASTSGIADADGLTNAAYSYQWQADDADISGATGETYTLAEADEGAAISVTVSFTDDAGNDETLTSAATAAVEAAPLTPLTALIENAAASHDGERVFTFELRFSEEFSISYKTLRDHAFTVTGGRVLKAQRIEQRSNLGWRITVRPDGNGAVTIVLPETTDCDAQGAICTEDGRKLSNELVLTVSGP